MQILEKEGWQLNPENKKKFLGWLNKHFLSIGGAVAGGATAGQTTNQK